MNNPLSNYSILFLIPVLIISAACSASRGVVNEPGPTPENSYNGITSNELIRIDTLNAKARVYGVVTEYQKPVSGVILFTDTHTSETTTEFISYENALNGEFSAYLAPGTYRVRILTDHQLEAGRIVLKSGEVRKLAVALEHSVD